MAKQTFSQWLAKDRNFAREIDVLQRKLVFLTLGIDPQAVADSWNGKEFTKEPQAFVTTSSTDTAALVEELHEKVDELSEKVDKLVALMTPKQASPPNQSAQKK